VKEDAMRKIRIIEHISLDGVIQGPGGPTEDDYIHGGWSVPHADPAVGAAIVAAHGDGFDLLLGRRTYDIWSGFWPTAGSSPMADSINSATKYIATHRPESLKWGPVEALGQDVVGGIRRVKATEGLDLIVWGSSTLTPLLLEHELADEVLLLVFPVLLGTGKRFFSDGTPPRELALVGTKTASSGVLISTYRPNGPLRTGSFGEEA
jgi:dihydrofolate reductase